MKWKSDWDQAKGHHIEWWKRKGLVLYLTAPRDVPIEDIPKSAEPSDPVEGLTDPVHRASQAEDGMAKTFYAADAFPYFDTNMGPGSLGTFLGAQPHLVSGTVWYDPCIEDPDTFGPIRFDPANHWFQVHLALIDEGLRRAQGRYLVGIPDLIENIDTLAAMRGNQNLLFDLIERPAWVHRCLAEINQAYFAAFDLMFEKVRDEDGGNAFAAFSVWGPGKTAKVQCDFSAMISAKMFRHFVAPYLSAQCEWLDYSLYHLDGTTALQHVGPLLEIESLDAIEWTPQTGKPGGGDPIWYDLYRQIKAGGKSVQAVGVAPDKVVPLIDAIGPEGLYVFTWTDDQASAEKLAEKVEQYR